MREPDGGELFALAPRLLMTLQDARASGLLGPGSRARNRLMTAGDERGNFHIFDFPEDATSPTPPN